MKDYDLIKLIMKEDLIEIGFKGSYDSERFKERIDLITTSCSKNVWT